jgi:predicted nucleotidyltransferase
VPRERVERLRDAAVVRYPPSRFATLEAKRAHALPFLRALPGPARVYGSVARGDVREGSDVDIDVPFGTTSFAVEVAISRVGGSAVRRSVVQATPNAVVKALWDFGPVTVSLPLTRPSPVEAGFGAFAGSVTREDVEAGRRVPGVDKRLMLIEPLPEGHRESSVANRVEECARLLRVDGEVVRARVRVLERRARKGRTGVFLSQTLRDDETPESALDRLSASNAAVRRAAGGRP